MLSSFIRRLTYSHVAAPVSGSTQSGPMHTKRWRRILPIPKSATGWSVVWYFCGIARDHTAPRLLPHRGGGSMANQQQSDRNDSDETRKPKDEQVRGIADDGDEAFEHGTDEDFEEDEKDQEEDEATR